MNLTPVPRSRVLVASAIAVALALCMLGGVGGDGLLCLAPALALAALLLARRYPGERLLSALARRRGDRRPRPSPACRLPLTLADARMPRGGLLMGFALAVRPPPAPGPAS